MSEIIQTIRAIRAGYEGQLAVCPAWDCGRRFYLEEMIRQSLEDEWLHSKEETK